MGRDFFFSAWDLVNSVDGCCRRLRFIPPILPMPSKAKSKVNAKVQGHCSQSMRKCYQYSDYLCSESRPRGWNFEETTKIQSQESQHHQTLLMDWKEIIFS